MKAEEVNRSSLRWAGSKKKLLPILQSLAPRNYERYIEPFCGSLCLYVALKPKEALVGDINEELVHFYKMMAWRPLSVAKIVHEFPADAATYYSQRQKDPHSLGAIARAARFLYLNRFCFNGVYRTNQKGYFNVPRGHGAGAIPSIEELVGFGRLVRRAEVHCCDFEFLVNQAERHDFVYLDPPYAGTEARDRGEYGVGAFKLPDIERLVETLELATERGAKIMLSYADLPEVRNKFKKWNVETLKVSRNVAGFAKSRCSVSEIILRNYD